MIVKNESRVIRRCLESVKPIIDYWVIVDTGSTDGTQEVIRDFFRDVPGELYERPWVDFEHNRNEAFDLARGKSDYLLFIDADERLLIQSFDRKKLVEEAYLAEVISTVNFSKMLFIKNHPDFRWKGVLHEILTKKNQLIKCKALPGVAIDYSPVEGQHPKDEKKFSQDAEILERAIKKEPDNAAYVFFLAQTYLCLKKWALALSWYEKRAAMGGAHTEQVFWSYYQAGRCQQILNFPSELFLTTFSKAYRYDPSRAEPLYQMATHYLQTRNPTAAYSIAKAALALPKPMIGCSLEAWIYDYGLSLLFADCARAMGQERQAEQAIRLLLRKKLPKEVEELAKKMI